MAEEVREKVRNLDRIEVLKEILKDNPKALAELDMWDYQSKTESYLEMSGQAGGGRRKNERKEAS